MSSLIKALCYIASYFSIFKNYCEIHTAINLSDYDYPSPKEVNGKSTIAIFGTNDIHGSAFPLKITHPVTNETYEYGGLDILATYIDIIRKEWGDKFIWLDGGDQFQGAIESRISNGSIITDFFNYFNLNGSAIGNHEWDFGQEFLKERMAEANWTYLAANVLNTTTNQTEFLPNTKNYKIYQVGGVKLGVIGLSTVETAFTTAGDLTGVKFLEYREIIVNSAKILREMGANAVILNTHVGVSCNDDFSEKMKLEIRKGSTKQNECESDSEITKLLDSLEEGTIDAVVAGHTHSIAHHWVNKIPVIQNVNGAYYSHVLYLTFNSTTKELVKEDSQIEGPLPTCSKIFENTRRCDYITKSDAEKSGDFKLFTFHGSLVQSNSDVQKSFKKWWDASKPYKVKLAYTEEKLTRNYNEESPLGNLVADSLIENTGAHISIVNPGSLRSMWFPGEILVEHAYNMFPFENVVVTFEMTGSEVKRMLSVIQGGKKGFYSTSGVTQRVNASPKSLKSVALYDGTEIDEAATYVIAANDFLAGGGDDFYDVKTWYELRNYKKYGLLRDAMIDHLKKVEYIKEGSLIDPFHPRLKIISENTNLSSDKSNTQLKFLDE